MDDDRQALLTTFLAESEENLAVIEQGLLALEAHPADDELLNGVFRAAHTLKGNAAALRFEQVVELAHLVEDVLSRLRVHTLPLAPDLVSLLLSAVDRLRQMLTGEADDSVPAAPDDGDVLGRLTRLLQPEPAGPKRPARRRKPATRRSGAGLAPAAGRSSPGAASAVEAAGASLAPGTLRVRIEKLDELLNLSGELAVARGRLQLILESATSVADLRRALEAYHESDRLYADLQELVMEVRMVSVGPVFRSFSRVVRDQAAALGKQARLVLQGEDVQVDTKILEQMRDPLTHLIRNALGHGLELPDRRKASGKDPCGVITLSARHDGGHVVFEVADDGAGLDRRRIVERARERGLAAADHELTDRQVYALVLEAGFSTSSSVTDLSGRGVGLDVVRRHVEALRGSLTIESRNGEGARFVARVPLTLAIIAGFAVAVDGETYLVPLESVLETSALDGAAAALDPASGHCVVQLRGEPLPCARLRTVFGLTEGARRREQVLVIQHQGRRLGLIVDVLLGESQAVIKPLGKLLRRLPAIAGSTILGTGRVALILDVAALLAEIEAAAEARSRPDAGLSPLQELAAEAGAR